MLRSAGGLRLMIAPPPRWDSRKTSCGGIRLTMAWQSPVAAFDPYHAAIAAPDPIRPDGKSIGPAAYDVKQNPVEIESRRRGLTAYVHSAPTRAPQTRNRGLSLQGRPQALDHVQTDAQQTTFGDVRGLPVPLRCFSENQLVQRQIRHRASQSRVLLLQLLQPPGLVKL